MNGKNILIRNAAKGLLGLELDQRQKHIEYMFGGLTLHIGTDNMTVTDDYSESSITWTVDSNQPNKQYRISIGQSMWNTNEWVISILDVNSSMAELDRTDSEMLLIDAVFSDPMEAFVEMESILDLNLDDRNGVLLAIYHMTEEDDIEGDLYME